MNDHNYKLWNTLSNEIDNSINYFNVAEIYANSRMRKTTLSI